MVVHALHQEKESSRPVLGDAVQVRFCVFWLWQCKVESSGQPVVLAWRRFPFPDWKPRCLLQLVVLLRLLPSRFLTSLQTNRSVQPCSELSTKTEITAEQM